MEGEDLLTCTRQDIRDTSPQGKSPFTIGRVLKLGAILGNTDVLDDLHPRDGFL